MGVKGMLIKFEIVLTHIEREKLLISVRYIYKTEFQLRILYYHFNFVISKGRSFILVILQKRLSSKVPVGVLHPV